MVAPISPIGDSPSKRAAFSVYKILLIICQFFCAAPILDSRKHFSIKVHYIWCTVYIFTILIATYSQEEVLEFSMSTIQKIWYMGEYVSNNLLVILGIVTCYYRKNCYKDYIVQLEQIKRRIRMYQLKTIRSDRNPRIDRQIILITLMGVLFFASTLLLDFICNSKNLFLFLQSSTTYVLPNITICLVIGQYWTLIKFITIQHYKLNSVIFDLDNRSNRGLVNPFSLLTEVLKEKKVSRQNTCTVLDDLRSIFIQLDALKGDVNNVFGLTIIVNFLASFLILSIQIFVVYKISDQGVASMWVLMLYTQLWIVLHTAKFVFILKVNNCVLDERARTVVILNEFDAGDTKTEDAINRFLLQLLVKTGVQIACGIIELNMGFLGGVISALSVYVIFLIQIDLGKITLIARASTNATIITTSTTLPAVIF